MKIPTILTALLVVMSVLVCGPSPANGDLVKFKHGAKKKCVVLEEDDDWVSLLTPMGEIKMPKGRIESIERESDEVNNALKQEWAQSNKMPKKESEQLKPVEKKVQVTRTYKVEVKRRRIMVGARDPELKSEVLVATFLIKDLGVVKGSRLFNISVTSYKSTPCEISPPDFYVLAKGDQRVNPHPLEGYADLNAKLGENESASGHIAFPTEAKLQTMVFRSDLANFDLNLETGEPVIKDEIF
jgi:hypothetical protein